MKKFFPTYSNKPAYNLFLGAIVLLTCLSSGCVGNSGRQGTGDVIAKFNGHSLYRDELNFFIPDSLDQADSVKYAQQYIDRWIQAMAVNEQAMNEIPELESRIELKEETYRNMLVEHEYALHLMEENEERFVVSEADIRNYYNKYPSKFVSRQPYYQYFYVKTTKADEYRVVNLIRSSDPEQIKELITWAQENASAFKLDSTYLVDSDLDRLAEGFQHGNIRRASIGTPYPYRHQEEGETYYDFFRMLDVIKVGEQMPLELCREQIINIIGNQRKSTLVEQTKKNLVQQAKAAKKVTIYTK
ncbi:hypothetical protein [Pontibacter sp. G13]|uniref:hypothetical protein n=1 Tax=Pontibacter sp. G13 TaxID=3074898 RepID=UPI0028897B8E|nr:hypothetical protein [Pontibacter sp. G13]WNJ21197.1 hypothetical protein RJD25_12075 [Pontibacter sp. G13]